MEGTRIPDAQLRTIPLLATPREAIAHYQALADAGMQYFLAVVNGHDMETVRLPAEEVTPAVGLARAKANEEEDASELREAAAGGRGAVGWNV